jgi:hypothetical protein
MNRAIRLLLGTALFSPPKTVGEIVGHQPTKVKGLLDILSPVAVEWLDEGLRVLERRYQAKGVLPCRADCVAGEQPSEVDYLECVAQVRDVGLEAY